MNLKKSYYLSERIYETMNCEEKQSEARKKYWSVSDFMSCHQIAHIS